MGILDILNPFKTKAGNIKTIKSPDEIREAKVTMSYLFDHIHQRLNDALVYLDRARKDDWDTAIKDIEASLEAAKELQSQMKG